MRILIVNVGDDSNISERQLKSLAEPGTELVIKTPQAIISSDEFNPVQASSAVVEEIKNSSNFDAYIINSFEDIGLEAAKEVTHKPVIGVGQAAFHVAEITSLKFSVIVNMKHSVAPVSRNIKKYGFGNKFGRVHALEEIEKNNEESTLDLVRREIKQAIEEEYAEAIALGVKDAEEWAPLLSKEFQIPVLYGLSCAIKFAEAVTPLHVTYVKKTTDGNKKNEPNKTIVVINANICEKMTKKIENNANSFASPTTNVKTVTNEHGAPCIECFIDEGAAATGIMKRIIEHPEADAFVIAGYNDMGLDAFRSITEKPVLGSGVASMHVATLLASRFSIVCPLARCIPCIYRTLRNSGFINRCEKVRPTDVPVMQFETTNRHEINTNSRTVGKEIEKAFVEDNVGAVLLGCSALGHVRQEMIAKFGLPVIDGVSSGVKLAEALITLGVKTSKIGGYAHPYKKQYVGLMSELSI